MRERLAGLGPRALHVALGVLAVLALLVPLRLAPAVSPPTRAFHDAIARLPRGATVLVACDFDPATSPELVPMTRTALRQLFGRGCRVMVMTLWSGGAGLADRLLRETAAEFPGRRDGVDYVDLGYKAGNETVMLLMGQGFAGACPADAAGRPARALPLLGHTRSYREVALLVSLSAGYPGTREWLQQVQARFHVPMVAGVSATAAPELYPYLQSGQLLGMIGGMPGAAEYEALRGERGLAAQGMEAQSVLHVFVALCLVLGLVVRPRREGGA